jgi:hypothetical protein
LQDPSQINGDNPTSVRRETSRTFKGKKKDRISEEKIDELQMNSTNKNTTDIPKEA